MLGAHRPLREILEETHWLEGMPTYVKAHVYEDAYETSFEVGEIVVRKGDPARAWLGVAEGLLKVSTVHRSGKVVMFSALPEGSWGGEGTVFNHEPYRYDIIAVRPSRVVHLPSATFRWLLDTSIEFNHLIIARLSARLGSLMAMVEIDRFDDQVARVACAIGVAFNPILHPRVGHLLTLSQTELGELIGMSRQSVSAALKKLEEEGLVTTSYGGIVVKKVQGLINYQEKD
jgi:CRP-like cAMP-binding protein